MSYRRALAVIKLLVEECSWKENDVLTDTQIEALKTACKSLKKSIYSAEVTDNDWK